MVPDSCSCVDALLLAGDDEAGQHRQHRAVHRHRHRHLVERDAVEQDLHVLDGVDRHAGLADVADDARMVAVVAAVGGEVEGDRQPCWPGGQRLAVEGVRLLGGREAGVLADRPGPAGVHRRARAAGEGREARQGAGVLEPFEVGGGVERLDGDALGRVPGEVFERPAAQFLLGQRFPVCPVAVIDPPPSCVVSGRGRRLFRHRSRAVHSVGHFRAAAAVCSRALLAIAGACQR